jgi:hypothetical protein
MLPLSLTRLGFTETEVVFFEVSRWGLEQERADGESADEAEDEAEVEDISEDDEEETDDVNEEDLHGFCTEF